MPVQAQTGLSGLSGMIGGGGGPSTLVLDTFTDTNGVRLASHTQDVGSGWTENTGTWDVLSNQAEELLTVSGNAYYCTTNTSSADVTITADITPGVGGGNVGRPGLIARYTDTNNFWLAEIISDVPGNFCYFNIYEKTGGTLTSRAATNSVNLWNSNVQKQMKFVLSGTTVTAYINDANSITYGSASSNQTITRHGMRSNHPSGAYTLLNNWDNFTVITP